MYTEDDIEQYADYSDWVREQIVKNEDDDIATSIKSSNPS